MDFSYSQEQHALRELAARQLGERFTDDFRKQFARSGQPYDTMLWARLAQAGLLGTAVGAQAGGSGLGLTELALLLEEQGRTLAALPLLPTLVMGALPLQKFGSPAQQALLPGVVAGEVLLTAALEEPSGTDAAHPATQATAFEGGWRLCGEKICVPYGAQAQRLLVPARSEEGVRMFLIEPGSAGLRIEPQIGYPQTQYFLNPRAGVAHHRE